jgi:hypothetical protein
MKNLRPPGESTGKIDLIMYHTCLCAGVVRLGSQANRCICTCIFLQILDLTLAVAS